MKPAIGVYLEVGARRVFAGALEWPGWCRSGQDEESALDALIAYAGRYAAALGRAAHRFRVPAAASALRVMERLVGNATTDFGAPAVAPSSDSKPLGTPELTRLSWRARGEPPAPSRRTSPPWTPRYAVRRSAWHALDHAWEIEDRASPA